MPTIRRNQAVIAAALFILLLSLYLLSYSGTFTSDDEQHLAAGAQTFAVTGQLGAMQLYGNARLQGGFHEVDPALSLIGSAVYSLVSRTSLGTMQALFLLTPVWTALAGVLVFLTGCRWGYAPQLSLWAALVFGLGSMAWPYAKTFFRDPLAMLFVAGVWLCLELALSKTQSKLGQVVYWGLLLVCLVGGILTKNIIIPLFPLVVLVGFLRIWRDSPQTAKLSPRLIGLLIVAGLLALLLIRPRSDNLFRSSGDYFIWLKEWLTVIPHSSFWSAFWGALISPGKGLLVFAPFGLLAIVSWVVAGRVAWQKLLGPSLWLVVIVAAQSFFYDYRWTNPQWGARYLLPALPGLAVAILPAADWLWQRSQPLANAVLGGTLGLGVLTQLPGVLIAPPAYSAIVQQIDRQAYRQLAIWDPYYSAVAGHWRLLLAGEPWALAAVRNFELEPLKVTLLLAMLIGMVVVAIVILRQPMSAWHWFAAPALSAVLLLVAPWLLLATYQREPAYFGQRPDLAETVQYLNARVTPTDLIAIRGYELWYSYFNYGRPVAAWAGLPIFDQPSDTVPSDPFYLPGLDAQAADLALFTAAPQTHQRLWYVDDGSTPAGLEGFNVDGWLAEHYTLQDHLAFGTGITVYLFGLKAGP